MQGWTRREVWTAEEGKTSGKSRTDVLGRTLTRRALLGGIVARWHTRGVSWSVAMDVTRGHLPHGLGRLGGRGVVE